MTMRPLWACIFISLPFICNSQTNGIEIGGGGGAINLGGGGGAINLGGGGGGGPVSLGGGDGGVGGGLGDTARGVGDAGVGGQGGGLGGVGGVGGGGPRNGATDGALDLSGAGDTPGAGGAVPLGGGGGGGEGGAINLGGGAGAGPGAGLDLPGPSSATEPGGAGTNQATGGISVDEGTGTVNPNTGPETTNTGGNNNGAGSNTNNFGGGPGGFGNINFPDFTSSFGNIGNNFPLPGNTNGNPNGNTNVGGGGGLGGNPNTNDNDVFGGFTGFGGNIGTGAGLPNPNANPNTNNVPRNNGFPSLDLNNNFNFGNTGATGGIRFPGDFNTNTFPGLDQIRFPPFSNANAGGFGEECRTPPEEPLPYKVDNSSVPQQVLQQIQVEFGARPELQLIAQWFSATQGQPAALPQDSIDQVSCPADYSVLTRFISAQNAECFVLPPPTQDPVIYAKCRCQRCREAPTGRASRINQCKPVLTPAVITVFCPLSSPVRVFPMRVQIPTACRCMLAQPQARRGL